MQLFLMILSVMGAAQDLAFAEGRDGKSLQIIECKPVQGRSEHVVLIHLDLSQLPFAFFPSDRPVLKVGNHEMRHGGNKRAISEIRIDSKSVTLIEEQKRLEPNMIRIPLQEIGRSEPSTFEASVTFGMAGSSSFQTYSCDSAVSEK